MRKEFLAGMGVSLAVIGLAASPASATTFVFPLSSATQISNSSGTDGNSRVFKAVTGTEQINVRVTGWSFDGSRIRDSYVGLFSAGLGVTSGDDNGGAQGQHTIDNEGRWDFLIFQFDTPVNLDQAKFTPFKITDRWSNRRNSGDTDATVGLGSASIPWTQQLALDDTPITSLSEIFSGGFITTTAGTTTNTRTIYAGDAYSGLWLIGAATTNTDKLDSFKLSNLAVTVASVSAVPEPTTWALMILGLGMIGFSMRRHQAMAAKLTYS